MKPPNFHNPSRTQPPIEYEDDDEIDEEEDHPVENFIHNGYPDEFNRQTHPKKRKLESFVSNYEFSPPRRETWNEEETFVLLELWGERYMELGRRSLRSDDWVELTEKVSEMSGVERTEVECRHQLDHLKNKYKKERSKIEIGHSTNWAFFKKMDVLLNMRSRGYCGLGCGVDSGEYVFMNPRVYLDKSNVLDEMRDSPGQSDNDDDDDEDNEEKEDNSARFLADSISKFGALYEKVEESKRKQVVELEKMRRDFQRELEVQKKRIVEEAEAEIEKIREMEGDEDEDDDDDDDVDGSDDDDDGDDSDASLENVS